MANEQNLRPGEYKLTLEEQKKGGIASGEARRNKKMMKEVLEAMLEVVPNKNNKKKNPHNLSYRDMATLGLIKGAVNGNSTNYKTILEVLGELASEKDTNTIEDLTPLAQMLKDDE